MVLLDLRFRAELPSKSCFVLLDLVHNMGIVITTIYQRLE